MTRTIHECMDWVNNDHRLRGWYEADRRTSRCTLRDFVAANRADIDQAIDSLVDSNGRYGGAVLGGVTA